MNNILNFIKKNAVVLTAVYLFLFLVQTCAVKNRGGKIRKLKSEISELKVKNDSLALLADTSTIKFYKLQGSLEVYNEINDEMSKLRRDNQLREFQNEKILPLKKEVENKINEYNQK